MNTMKKLIAAAVGTCVGAGAWAADTLELKSETAQTSYALGYQIGGDMKRQQVDIDSVAVVQGIVDARKGDTPRMSEESMRHTLMELKRKIVAQERANAMPEIDHAAEAAKKGAEKAAEPEHSSSQDKPAAAPHAKRLSAQGNENAQVFFAENAKKEGVITLPSGVQYKVLKEGAGKQPKGTDKVELVYHGSMANGKEFGNTDKNGKPDSQTFALDSLIPGLRDAVSQMKEGAEWRVYIPPQLGFDAGTPLYRKITVFDVKLAAVASN